MNTYNFKLKGTGEIEYHLGTSFRRNDRNELCISPQWYIEKMVDNYKQLFGESPSHCSQTPLESNPNPNPNNVLSFHHVHEAIASGYVVLTYLPGKFNPADILSKHWGYQTIWLILKPILFFHGDTADLIQDDDTV
jgi:hypothetical protein